MTSSTLGDDARGAGLGWTSQEASIIRMVYHVSIHNVNPGGMIADRS
jgi:POT family proton-dependent oligopeptide transporter